MAGAVSRRNFLWGVRPRETVVRPPWAVVESLFMQRCDGCGDCAGACQQDIITIEDGYPRLDFSKGKGECLFCEDCAAACSKGALSLEEARPWRWLAEIGGSCLSFQRVTCRTCGDSCETRAIRFRRASSGCEVPLVDEMACTGCGACQHVCPVGAIRFVETTERTVEAVQ